MVHKIRKPFAWLSFQGDTKNRDGLEGFPGSSENFQNCFPESLSSHRKPRRLCKRGLKKEQPQPELGEITGAKASGAEKPFILAFIGWQAAIQTPKEVCDSSEETVHLLIQQTGKGAASWNHEPPFRLLAP